MYNVVNTLAPSFLQISRTTIKYRMRSKFGQNEPWTAAFAALERLKKYFTNLTTIQNSFMICWLLGERSLPFCATCCKVMIVNMVNTHIYSWTIVMWRKLWTVCLSTVS